MINPEFFSLQLSCHTAISIAREPRRQFLSPISDIRILFALGLVYTRLIVVSTARDLHHLTPRFINSRSVR